MIVRYIDTIVRYSCRWPTPIARNEFPTGNKVQEGATQESRTQVHKGAPASEENPVPDGVFKQPVYHEPLDESQEEHHQKPTPIDNAGDTFSR